MIILCDIDHTLSDAAWRDEWLGTWDKYHSLLIDDDPIHETIELINRLWDSGAQIVLLTARPGKWRDLTEQWLSHNNVHYSEILMRDDDDFHPSDELKWKLVNERFFLDTPDRIVLLDDRGDVCKRFWEAGITVLQVHARKSLMDTSFVEAVK